ncbi:hypothetical protein HanRHA438_Chr15g0725901 [Helianthus annuus]|nr:hypothetical protein HanRHA438_Chr15g0725901 [Helianthus annuus]
MAHLLHLPENSKDRAHLLLQFHLITRLIEFNFLYSNGHIYLGPHTLLSFSGPSSTSYTRRSRRRREVAARCALRRRTRTNRGRPPYRIA